MEIRILQKEEIDIAAKISRLVFDNCLRNRMEYEQTIAYVEEYISESNLSMLCEESKLLLWGAYDGEYLVGVAGMQADGMITVMYVLPQWQDKGYGGRLIEVMGKYAKDVLGLSKITVNANPAWTSSFFLKKGFAYLNPNQSMRVPFASMYATTEEIIRYEKRPVPAVWMTVAALGSVLFATIAGCWFMIAYLF